MMEPFDVGDDIGTDAAPCLLCDWFGRFLGEPDGVEFVEDIASTHHETSPGLNLSGSPSICSPAHRHQRRLP